MFNFDKLFVCFVNCIELQICQVKLTGEKYKFNKSVLPAFRSLGLLLSFISVGEYEYCALPLCIQLYDIKGISGPGWVLIHSLSI